MATLGDILRQAREERGISLSEAERETKIRQKYISALEDDNLAALPSSVYARGFLRNYAAYLDIDTAEALELFDQQAQPARTRIKAARGEPVANGSTPMERINIQPLSPEPIDTRVRYGIQYIAVSLLALPLIIAFYFIYNAYAGRNGEIPIPTAIPRPATVTPLPLPTLVLGGPATGAFNTPTVAIAPTPSGSGVAQIVTGTATLTVSPALTVPPASKVTARITTTRDAWMRVIVDGVQVYSGTLPKGTTRQWIGQNTVRIRTGRADSVRISVNGADLGLMGNPNNLIVEKQWDKSGNETVIQN